MQGVSTTALLLVLVLAAAPAAFAEEPRPNLTEWKAGQAEEAAAKDAVVAKQKKMAAVDKAVDLLEALHEQVLEEGEAEAKTYNKFACFCKDTTKEKLEEIQKNEDTKADLYADIGALESKREGLDGAIADAEQAIKDAEQAMKELTEERAKTKKQYDMDAADLKAALDALEGALATLKASKTPSLAQLSSVRQTVRDAAMLADALGLGSVGAKKSITMFLQQEPDAAPANEVQMEDYKFHSNDIIKTLE